MSKPENNVADGARSQTANRHSESAALCILTSVWTGVGLMALIIAYGSVGILAPSVRASFELSAVEWFRSTVFLILVLALCVNTGVATFIKIPATRAKLGAWLAHIGLILLCLGSIIYFGKKQDGDMPVFRRRVVCGERHCPALPGARLSLPETNHTLIIDDVLPEFEIKDGKNKGKTVVAVFVRVLKNDPLARTTYTRRLLDGLPDETEDFLNSDDVIDGKRPVVAFGGTVSARALIQEPILDPSLMVTLDLEPQPYYYIQESSALYLRPWEYFGFDDISADGALITEEWRQRPIVGLPRYHEFIPDLNEVYLPDGFTVEPRALNIDASPLPVEDGSLEARDPLRRIPIRVTGFLPYAEWETRHCESNPQTADTENPYLQIELTSPTGGVRTIELFAKDPDRHFAETDGLAFYVAQSADDKAAFISGSGFVAEISVAGVKGFAAEPLRADTVASFSDSFIPILDSGYAYRVRHCEFDSNRFGTEWPKAAIDLKSPTRYVTRWVEPDPSETFDAPYANPVGMYPLSNTKRIQDDKIRIKLQPKRLLTIIGGPAPRELTALILTSQGVIVEPLGDRQPLTLANGTTVRLTSQLTHAVKDMRPSVIHPSRRLPSAGAFYSMIRVETGTGEHAAKYWLAFNSYALPDHNYRYPKMEGNRFAYHSLMARPPDSLPVELLYSRERFVLPRPVALESFNVSTHIGGLTASDLSVLDWESRLVFQDPDAPQRAETKSMRLNQPAISDHLLFYQHQWDRPNRTDGGAYRDGLLYTGVGVATRDGIWMMFIGALFIIAGLIDAFYLLPICRRAGRSKALSQPVEPKGGAI